MFIVELEKGVFLAPWDGDPGRTLVEGSAKQFKKQATAFAALEKAQESRRFSSSKVLEV